MVSIKPNAVLRQVITRVKPIARPAPKALATRSRKYVETGINIALAGIFAIVMSIFLLAGFFLRHRRK